jgi:hypothetical protein
VKRASVRGDGRLASTICWCGGETSRGQSSGDEPVDLAVRENPWRAKNPMGVSGMKQGRAFGRGVSRREGAKP